jgi:hypothetical protein
MGRNKTMRSRSASTLGFFYVGESRAMKLGKNAEWAFFFVVDAGTITLAVQ